MAEIELLASTFVEGADALEVEALHAAVQNAGALGPNGSSPVLKL